MENLAAKTQWPFDLMYTTVLTLHSLLRWLVLGSLLLAFGRALAGWTGHRKFSSADNSIRHWTATIAHLQLIFGSWLYVISPVVQYFLEDYKTAVHQRQIRFFGMEHSLMMLTAIILVTIGSMKAKRQTSDHGKFKTMVFWYGAALLIIFLSIPWPFSPMANRPLFRWF